MFSFIKKLVLILLSIPKTLYFNWHYFRLKKCPVIVSHKVKLEKLGDKNSIICKSNWFSIKLGFNDGSFNIGKNHKSYFFHDNNSKILLGDNVSFVNNFHLKINENSTLSIGDNSSFNSNFILSCDNNIQIGNNCLTGWNVTIIDGDGHSIIYEKKVINKPKKIEISDNVWISSNVILLKGTKIMKDSIVASGSLVCKEIDSSNVIIGGNPSKILKKNVTWEYEYKEN